MKYVIIVQQPICAQSHLYVLLKRIKVINWVDLLGIKRLKIRASLRMSFNRLNLIKSLLIVTSKFNYQLLKILPAAEICTGNVHDEPKLIKLSCGKNERADGEIRGL